MEKLLYLASRSSNINCERAFRIGRAYFKKYFQPITKENLGFHMENLYLKYIQQKGLSEYLKRDDKSARFYKLRFVSFIAHVVGRIIVTSDKMEFIKHFSILAEINFPDNPHLTNLNNLFSDESHVDFRKIPDLFYIGMIKWLEFLSSLNFKRNVIDELPKEFEKFLKGLRHQDKITTDNLPILRTLNYLSNPRKLERIIFDWHDGQIPRGTSELLKRSGCEELKKSMESLEMLNYENLNKLELSESVYIPDPEELENHSKREISDFLNTSQVTGKINGSQHDGAENFFQRIL